MKITCSKEDKEKIISVFSKSPYCFGSPIRLGISGACRYENCRKCLENTIEWDVTDGDSE